MSFKASDNDRTLYQNRVRSYVANSADVTAQAVLSADRQSIRISLTTVDSKTPTTKAVQVVSPVFPGAAASKP
jgi:hypothetical protein